MVASVESFETGLKEIVLAKRLSGSKLKTLTDTALKIVESDTQVVSILYRTHKSLPTASKVNSLYVFDSIARAARSYVNKRNIVADANTEIGNCATLLLKLDGVLDGLFNDMISTGASELKEKLQKILDIWGKAQTFPQRTLQRLQKVVKDAGEKEPKDVKAVTVDPRTSKSPPVPSPEVATPSPAASTAATINDVDLAAQRRLLELLQGAQAGQAISIPSVVSATSPPPRPTSIVQPIPFVPHGDGPPRHQGPPPPTFSPTQAHRSPPQRTIPAPRIVPPSVPGQLPPPLGIPAPKVPKGGLPTPLGVPSAMAGKPHRTSGARDPRNNSRGNYAPPPPPSGQQIETFVSDAASAQRFERQAPFDGPPPPDTSFDAGSSFEAPVYDGPPRPEVQGLPIPSYDGPSRPGYEQGQRASYDRSGYDNGGPPPPTRDPRFAGSPPNDRPQTHSYDQGQGQQPPFGQRWDEPPNFNGNGSGSGSGHYGDTSSSGKGVYVRESPASFERDSSASRSPTGGRGPFPQGGRGRGRGRGSHAPSRWDQPPTTNGNGREWIPRTEAQRERSRSPPSRNGGGPPSSATRRDNRAYSPPRRPVMADMSSSYPADQGSPPGVVLDEFGRAQRALSPAVAANAGGNSQVPRASFVTPDTIQQPGLEAFVLATFNFTDPAAWNTLAMMWSTTYGWDPSQEDLMQFVMTGGMVRPAMPVVAAPTPAFVLPQVEPEPQPQPSPASVPEPAPAAAPMGFIQLKALVARKKKVTSVEQPAPAAQELLEDIDGDSLPEEDIDGQEMADDSEPPPDPRLRMRRQWKGHVPASASSEDGDAMDESD